VIATLFTLTAMAVMLLFFVSRNVEAESLYLTSGQEPDGDTEKVREEGKTGDETGRAELKEGYLCIPLEEGVGRADVRTSYDIGSCTMSVTVPVSDSGFYYENNLYGSRDHVKNVEFRDDGNEVTFDIINDDRMAPETVFEDRKLYIAFKPLVELYDRIILIDPGHGGSDSGTEAYDFLEKDITLGVSKELESILDEDSGVFFTRSGDQDLPEKDREKKAVDLGASLVISLQTNADRDTRITRGMELSYSDDSVSDAAKSLAQSLEKVTGVENVAVVKKKETGYFDETGIPCIVIRLGYMTNRAEAEMMSEGDFQKQTASAIASVIDRQ